jgi:hypothetical protein
VLVGLEVRREEDALAILQMNDVRKTHRNFSMFRWIAFLLKSGWTIVILRFSEKSPSSSANSGIILKIPELSAISRIALPR